MAVLTRAGSFLRPLPSFPYAATPITPLTNIQIIPQMAIDGSENFYLITNFTSDHLHKFNSAGSSVDFETLAGASGVAVDAGNNVYVAFQAATLRKYNGNLSQQWSVSSGLGFNKLAADSTYLYVTSSNGNGVLRVRLSDGGGLTSVIVGSSGSGNGQFAAGPTGIAHDGNGNLYVLDPGNSRVQKFTTGGTFVTKWGSAGAGDGQFNDPTGVAVDPITGHVFVTDRDNSRVQVFRPDGTFVTKFGTGGTGNGQFSLPQGIAFNSAGDCFVADGGAGSGRVQKFTRSLQSAVTGLGFQPKAIVWLGSNTLTSGTVRANAELSIGLTARLTSVGAANTKSLGIFSADAAASPATRIKARDDLGLDNNGTVLWKSSAVTLDADGFTVTWNSATYDGEQERIAYLALGQDADARAFGSTSTTVFGSGDSIGTTKTQSFGDSFTPTGALIAASCSTGETGSFGVAAQKSGGFDQWAQAYGGNATADPSQAHSALVNDAAICLIDQTGTIYFKAVVDSWNSSGITYRVTLNTLPVGVTVRVFGVALNGTTMQAGTAAKAAGAAPASQVVPIAELPKALLLAGTRMTSSGVVDNDLRAALGLSDGTNHATAATVVENGVGTSDADTVMLTGKAFVTPVGTPPNSPDQATVAFNAPPSANVTLTWNPNTANAYAFGWFALLRAVTPLSGAATVQTGGGTVNLRLNHAGKLLGSATVVSGGGTVNLRLNQKLKGAAAFTIGGPSPLLKGQAPLSGAAHVSVGSATDFAFLVESHVLTGSAVLDIGNKNQPGWLGNVFQFSGKPLIGTHVLRGEALLAVSGPDPRLKVGAGLTGNGLLEILAAHTWPPQAHPLLGAALIAVDAKPPLLGRFPGELTGTAFIEVLTTGLTHLGSAVRLTGNALVAVGTYTLGLGGANLPIPKSLGPDDLVGTVNLFRNPSFERDDLADVFSLNGATAQIAGTGGWHGAAALKVDLAHQVNSGVTLRSLRGLPYKGAANGFLGQFRVMAESEISHDLTALLRVVYTDGSDDEGEPITWNPTPDDRWQTVFAPVAVANSAKQVDYLDIVVTRPLAVAGQTIYLDGVQPELDRGHAHTPFAIGTYGEPYHRWWGGAHASITIRDAIPLDSSAPSMQGEYRIEAFMYRADADNTFLEDLSPYVINAVVTADAERDVSWTLECEMLPEGWRKIEPFVDWLAPYMRVTMPNGDVKEGQLGHFVVLPSPRQVDEWGERVQVDGRSGEVLLQMQGTKGFMFLKEGKPLIRAARVVLDNCHLGENERGKARHNLPDDNEKAHRDMTWEKKEDALQIVNDLLKKAGKKPLFATKTGVLTSVDRKKRRLKKIDPVRVWGANLPANHSHLEPWVSREGATHTEVVGTVSLTPDLGKWDDNKIVVVSVNPRKKGIRVVRYINDPDNPVNPRKRKRIKERRVEMDIGSHADAERLAEAIAEEIGSKLETVELSVLPDPEPNFLRQPVYLAIHDHQKERVAVGKFAVHSVTYGWTADEALMTLNLGFIQSTDQLAGADPTGWEIAGSWSPD